MSKPVTVTLDERTWGSVQACLDVEARRLTDIMKDAKSGRQMQVLYDEVVLINVAKATILARLGEVNND